MGMTTGSSSNLGGARCISGEASTAFRTPASLAPFWTELPTWAESALLFEQFGSLVRHSAIFISQPHGQPLVRSTLRARAFCAEVRPVKSTIGRLCDVCQSWAIRRVAVKAQSKVPLTDEKAMPSL